ncbi:hypothetical protein [Winogradskyella tangerina]|uniref:hypothetical protein n=1 Tax=Winogradskyella tangerina TaxID=2023240 RepID=UPI000DBE4089|nr:hypothetical protein [Winogradskyella tangerina]
MKKTSILFLILTITINSLKAQVNSSYARNSFAEKIYLQTDNQIYTANSTIWFKAAVVNAATLSGELSSGVLYVDLINSKNEIVDHKILKLNEGLGNGYFDIGSSIEDGHYRIRAYTEWNKNFSEDFMFTKSLQIIRSQLKDDYKEAKKSKNRKIVYTEKESDARKIDVQFFPEGGKLIHNIASKVGFKAIDINGLGIAISGEILDGNNKVIANFESNSLGMGHFVFEDPDHTKVYRSRITSIDGKAADKTVALPTIYKEGVSLQVNETENAIEIEVNSKSFPDKAVRLKGYSRGITYIDNPLDITNAVGNFSIPKTQLPEGIMIFSVSDAQNRIVAERMYFNNNGMSSLKIDASLNKQKFSTRDEVVLSMKADTELQTEATNQFDTSVLVIDKSRIDIDGSRGGNLLTYLLLTSDLKGHIESPHLYFEANSNYNIDDLMLTQGWRNYKYDTTVNNVFKYRREMGIPIKGVINSKNSNEIVSGKDFTIMDFGRDFSLMNTKLDVPGSFYFEIGDLFGDYNKLVIQPSSINENEKDNIHLTLSEKFEVPVKPLEANTFYVEESVTKAVVEQKKEIMQIEKDYFKNLYGYNQLDEVTVYGYTMTPKRREMAEKYGLPNTVIDGKDIQRKIRKSSNGLVDVLMSFRDKVYVETRAKRSNFYQPRRINVGLVQPGPSTFQTYLRMGTNHGGRGHVNMVVVDGIPVNALNHYLTEDIEPTEVTSFEIIDDPKRLKQLYAEVFNTYPPPGLLLGSILSIYTRNGTGIFGALNQGKDLKTFNVEGFSPSKEFYVPRYDTEANYYGNQPDYRPTIYWAPHVKSKDNEEATVKFYHSDNEGDFIVFLETISKDGKIGYKEIEYSVSKTDND